MDELKLGMCRAIAQRFPEALFWKHLGHALNGGGDVDMLLPVDQHDEAVASVAQLAQEIYGDVEAVVQCRHLRDISLVFVARSSTFPVLEEFDFGNVQTRFRMPWMSWRQLYEVSRPGDHGLRMLRPGAEAVVLAMLYCVQFRSGLNLKPHDAESLVRGWREDRSGVEQAVDLLLPAVLRSAVLGFLSAGAERSHWDGRRMWVACAASAAAFHVANRGEFLFRGSRLGTPCFIRETVDLRTRTARLDLSTWISGLERSGARRGAGVWVCE